MDIDKNELNKTIRLLMKNMGDSQTKVGAVIGLSQPQVGQRLRSPDDEEAIDWKFGELRDIARHWGIPLTTMCSGRAAAMQWVTDNVIDLTGKPDQGRRISTWNTVEQLDLFSLSPQAADMRAGGVLWEFSDRSSVDTPTSDEDAVSGRVRQLVA